ncbi:MaoC family dehydratase [Pseudomonas sp. DR48]|uniref:MaoC family dehydratase n=1 Tax=Pseudomonas sp. DR48 TaxID=2871095 RepID=UPI001C991409|nr:MaoC/PaaZ C-terminal domain-containing protein [Pseudomonas sp. DR48]QZP31623.1 MaoC family dehydratase N-terminal domain-containing protein [Pseudomonas sp. DR48]
MEVTFDSIQIGATYRSAGRTIIDADIVNFAGLSGDFNPLHMDEVWVRENTNFPSRIAHGLLVHSIGEGLACPGVTDWKILAFLETQRRMVKPVLPGDRIVQQYTVAAKAPSTKNPSKGVVEVHVSVLNQAGEVVQEGYNKYLIGGAE